MAQDLFLYETLCEQLAARIRRGGFAPGERLPSVRALSKAFGVSINTTVQSLRKLELDGYIEVRERSGAYVRERLPANESTGVVSHFPLLPVEVSLSEDILRYMEPHTLEQTLHLGIALPDASLMPVDRLMRLWRDSSRRQPQVLWDYSHPNGLPRLTKQLSQRSIGYPSAIQEQDILVTNGCMEAMELALRAVSRPGDVVAVESPTYYGTLLALGVLNRRVLEISTHHREGICLYTLEQAFRRGQVKACIVSCNGQNPLGYVMSAERKQRLVELVVRYQVPLIENDIWGDTAYAGDALPAKAFDQQGMVIYCTSFSKTLMPGLRLGWVAVGGFMIGCANSSRSAVSPPRRRRSWSWRAFWRAVPMPSICCACAANCSSRRWMRWRWCASHFRPAPGCSRPRAVACCGSGCQSGVIPGTCFSRP